MRWVWQQPEWPNFSWDRSRLARAEERFLIDGGMFAGSFRHLDSGSRMQFIVEAMSVEALTTSEIEGEILDRASLQSSIRRQLALETDRRRVRPAEAGIAEMMVDLHRTFAEPLTHDMLFGWHRMLAADRRDLKNIGRYRTHDDPMQVVSGPLHAPKVHFEAPPSARMPEQMEGFLEWFNRTAPDGSDPLPALTRAGLAHFYFVCIHPFEDGNGRIGRAIAEKGLAQNLGYPALTMLAATILAQRKAYYEAIERNNTGIEITDWMVWFAEAALEAQHRTTALVEFVIDKARLLDRMLPVLNERQQKALLRILREGPGGFEGGLSAGNYIRITGAATATATRDLADMVAKGALIRTGERRHARYHADLPLRQVTPLRIGRNGQLIDDKIHHEPVRPDSA